MTCPQTEAKPASDRVAQQLASDAADDGRFNRSGSRVRRRFMSSPNSAVRRTTGAEDDVLVDKVSAFGQWFWNQ